uniref:REC114 meiotic recombination protein n=1 Tax=Leptobrachium leishanense TaxID=445787 RepID=A0A8C5QGX8_9ANUR
MAEGATSGVQGFEEEEDDDLEWPLRRYGRLEGAGEGQKDQSEWKIYESDQESSSLLLCILSTGHFFISQRHTLLEGFSLISARTWLKVGKKSDCLLFGSRTKEYHRMFKIQFSGPTPDKALENCDRCLQKLKAYLSVQDESGEEQSLSGPGQRISLTKLVHSVLNPQETRPTFPPPALSSEELGSFLKVCLLDQHFPAFVEAVEKELHKLAERQ